MSVLDLFRLDGKLAVVTGSSRGLGFEIAKALAEAGADVVISARDAQELQFAAAKIQEASGRTVHTMVADLANAAGAEAFCDELLKRFADIDILVNNVGGRRINTPVEEMSADDWQMVLDVNLTQAFVCTRRVGARMLARGYGRIINISSISGLIAFRPAPSRSYEAAKTGLLGFTRSVAADWADRGVTVNAIAPGPFLTEVHRPKLAADPALLESFVREIPMGRLGRPEELGPAAVFLASDASSYITGATLVIDGGQTLW